MEHTYSFGYWLRRRRKALDLTQAELAQRVGCSLDLIQKIEADARRPSRQLAERLADSLGIEVAERSAFVQVARSERTADQLALPTQAGTPPVATLPEGTVTFLFTNIDGSSRLWERYWQAMPAVLARHNALLSEIVATHGGVVFKTVGDGILAAFAQAPDALAAALAAQRAIGMEAWELPEPPRVRIALHSGGASVHNGDYVGPALHRTARLLAAGHGGQILLSLATEQLAREQLPVGASLRDLGEHGLHDLSLPERVFQLLAPDLPDDFLAPGLPAARRTNLPAPLTSLLGREQEVSSLIALMREPAVRLVTLTGPGGIGKTRLGVQVAGEMLDDFAHGVYFVDLAPVRDPELVAGAIASALGVREMGGQPVLDALKGYLGEKSLVIVLDNFEQVLEAAPLVAELLTAAPQLKMLATSREALHLRGEREWPLAPLALPDGAALPLPEQLSQYAAVALLIQRAVDHMPSFQVTNENAPAVAEICARLDGLPLAIELAAARLKLFAPEALLARLSSRLTLLTGGARDLPARQQTIRSTIAWSYDLLDAAEQMLFRRLAVFVGGWTLEAAEAVCGAEVVDGLIALVDKSLVRPAPAGEEPRFGMLETIREFALERLEASGEAEELRRRHTHYYLGLGDREFRERSEQGLSLELKAQLNPDFDNLRSALLWSQSPAGDSEAALQLTWMLFGLWEDHGIQQEAITAFERTLNHPLGVGRTHAHAVVRYDLAMLLADDGNYPAARIQYEQALELAQEIGGTYWWALWGLGHMAREQGDSETAWARLTDCLALCRELGDANGIVVTLNTMAEVAILDEDPARAEALLEESGVLEQPEQAGPQMVGWTLNHLGHAAQLRGDYDRAVELHYESLKWFQVLGEQLYPLAYQSLGETALGLGNLDEARRWLAQGLTRSRTLNSQSGIVWCLAGLGTVAALSDQPERAARLWGVAERLRQTIGCRPAPAARATYERAMAQARAQLTEERFARAWAVGAKMNLEQAIAEAQIGQIGGNISHASDRA